MKYQYHVYNKYIDLIITSPIKEEEYAETLAKRVAVDFYSLDERYLKEVKCVFVCEFMMESVVNLNLLKRDV